MADVAVGAAGEVTAVMAEVHGGEADRDEQAMQRAGGRSTRSSLVVNSLLLLVLLAGVAFAGIQAKTWRDDRRADTDRREAVAAAKQVTLALSEINFKTADSQISAISNLTTGELRQTIVKNAKAQAAIAQEFKVTSTATVDAAGVVSQKPASILVAVAVSSHVRSSQSQAAQPHWFRVDVLVDKQSDGRWLASKVEFVQ